MSDEPEIPDDDTKDNVLSALGLGVIDAATAVKLLIQERRREQREQIPAPLAEGDDKT